MQQLEQEGELIKAKSNDEDHDAIGEQEKELIKVRIVDRDTDEVDGVDEEEDVILAVFEITFYQEIVGEDK